jgi:hypothetical protein
MNPAAEAERPHWETGLDALARQIEDAVGRLAA